MEPLSVAERLKDTTRHCYTRNGRHESVAEHSWMMTLMAFFMKYEFPKVDMDKASSIETRMNTLKVLNENGIHTVLFMSPIFPEITDYQEIIEKSRLFVDEYWFENLNLRGEYKAWVLRYINEKYPQYAVLYKQIYVEGDKSYWNKLAEEIEVYCTERSIIYTNFFYHEQLVAKKKENKQYS